MEEKRAKCFEYISKRIEKTRRKGKKKKKCSRFVARRNGKEREGAGKPNGYSRSVTWVLSYIFPQEGGNVVS